MVPEVMARISACPNAPLPSLAFLRHISEMDGMFSRVWSWPAKPSTVSLNRGMYAFPRAA